MVVHIEFSNVRVLSQATVANTKVDEDTLKSCLLMTVYILHEIDE